MEDILAKKKMEPDGPERLQGARLKVLHQVITYKNGLDTRVRVSGPDPHSILSMMTIPFSCEPHSIFCKVDPEDQHFHHYKNIQNFVDMNDN